MIIHKLIAHHLGHKDDAEFYRLQAGDAIAWLTKKGVTLTTGTSVLDLGCGHGLFGAELLNRGCKVTFADDENYLLPGVPARLFHKHSIGKDVLGDLGRFDLVILSNVLEHLARPLEFLEKAHELLTPGGGFFLSWTNWLSPWGGHEFSPFHYLGTRLGPRVFDLVARKKRAHTPYVNLFPTYIGSTLRYLRSLPDLELVAVAPRYYSELTLITKLPLLREFLTWNCGVLLRRK